MRSGVVSTSSVEVLEGKDAAVCVLNVRKSYGEVQAVRGISMELRTGCITALLGHNGAGKSTLVGVITGEGSSPLPTCLPNICRTLPLGSVDSARYSIYLDTDEIVNYLELVTLRCRHVSIYTLRG